MAMRLSLQPSGLRRLEVFSVCLHRSCPTSASLPGSAVRTLTTWRWSSPLVPRASVGLLPASSRLGASTLGPFLVTAKQQVAFYSNEKDTSDKDFKQDVEDNLQTMREGKFEKKVTHPEVLQHFRVSQSSLTETKKSELADKKEVPPIGTNALPHPIWTEDDLYSVKVTHMEPKNMTDRLAYFAVKLLRGGFDLLSGYNRRTRDESVWLSRIIFLETVAGVPGMVAAMVRHLHSLRRMRRDHGWIHTLLEEAENERMHLMTAMQLRKPNFLFRWAVVATQGVFVGGFSIAYLLSPKFCHRFVGYLEEEAVITYSKLLKDMDEGEMTHWKTQPAPAIAIQYWQLSPDAVMRDVVLAIRADEAHHRVVNHTLGSMKPDDYNPYKPGQ